MRHPNKEEYQSLHCLIHTVREKSVQFSMEESQGKFESQWRSAPRSTLHSSTDHMLDSIMMFPHEETLQIATWFVRKELE